MQSIVRSQLEGHTVDVETAIRIEEALGQLGYQVNHGNVGTALAAVESIVDRGQEVTTEGIVALLRDPDGVRRDRSRRSHRRSR